jgi:hypothetical protein
MTGFILKESNSLSPMERCVYMLGRERARGKEKNWKCKVNAPSP